VGFIVWADPGACNSSFPLATRPCMQAGDTQAAEADEPWPRGGLHGDADVPEGQPVLPSSSGPAALLVKGGAGSLGPLQIVECTERPPAFRRLGPVSANQAMPNWFRGAVDWRFTSLGRYPYAHPLGVERASPRWLLGRGPVQLLGPDRRWSSGSWNESTRLFHILSPDPAIRGQTVQMVQARTHFPLWPPGFPFAACTAPRVPSVRATFFEPLTITSPVL